MKTIKEIFNYIHGVDGDLAHQFLCMVIEKYGRDDPRVIEIFVKAEGDQH